MQIVRLAGCMLDKKKPSDRARKRDGQMFVSTISVIYVEIAFQRVINICRDINIIK